MTLKAAKPIHKEKYPDICQTWGDWIKTRRLDLKLTKRQLSLKLNVSDITIYLWEKNKAQPSLAKIPKIIEFLGFEPFKTEARNLADKIKSYRYLHGLSQKKFAELLAVDQTTLVGWESGHHQASKKMLDKIKSVLGLCP